MNEKLSRILNDPEQIHQIMEMANQVGLIGSNNSQDKIGTTAIPSIPDISRLLKQAQKTDEKQEALFRALRPYLKPSRQSKLDRALKLAKLSQLAGAALRADGYDPEQGG